LFWRDGYGSTGPGVGIPIESRGHYAIEFSQRTPQSGGDEKESGKYKEGKKVRG